MTYDLKPLKAPRARGWQLRALTAALENPLVGSLLAPGLLRDTGLESIRQPSHEPIPTAHPVRECPVPVPAAMGPGTDSSVTPPAGSFRFETASDFTAAYRAGTTTPSEVAERVIQATANLDTGPLPLRIMIAQDAADLWAQAETSTERYRQGRPLGPLDGVPIAVKDEIAQASYPMTVGTRFLGKLPEQQDAVVVERLRAAGALLIGKTNMHEIGIGPTGLNPFHGPARNPYDPHRITGGSSSGTAAAVAAGLCPIAIGADGGGSIRIPAGLCGVVGLKPTFGRVSTHGSNSLCSSVGHYGPIAATVADMALAYMAIAGPDPRDPATTGQPAPAVGDFTSGDLTGIRLGVFRPWFEDADPPVVAACRAMLEQLVDRGATVVPIELPELAAMSAVHTFTIGLEMFAGYQQEVATQRRSFSLEARINFALLRHLSPTDYIQAQRHRVRLCRQFARVFDQVDAIVTPATACVATPIHPDAVSDGESDLGLTMKLMRFMQPGNLTGLPAISFPAGYDPDGLPIGMQAIARAWDEALLLRLAAVAEAIVVRIRPQVHEPLLGAPATITGSMTVDPKPTGV